MLFLPKGISQELDSASRLMRSDPDRALEHIDQSLAFAKKQNLDSLELQALVLRGELFMRTGRYDESRKDLEHARVLAMNSNDSSMLGAIHGHFGGLAFFQSQFDRATEELLTAISYSTDEAFRARTFNNLGSIFERIGDDQKALTYFNKALKLHRAAGREQLAASTLGNIGVILHKQELFEEAIRHFRESAAMAASMQDTFALSIRWQNLGNSFLETTRFDSARVYFDRALAASRTIRDTFGMASIYNSRASLYERIQLPDSIISNRQQAYQLAMSIGDTTDMIQAQLALSRAYADQGDFQRAYRAQQLYHNLDSDVSEREQNDRLYELEARYQNVAKEKQLQELATAIRKVYGGEQYLSKEVQKRLIAKATRQKTESQAFIPKLTRREKEVLDLIVAEHTNQEIAAKLFITVSTVETHRMNLCTKLNARNTAGLVRNAIKFDLI